MITIYLGRSYLEKEHSMDPRSNFRLKIVGRIWQLGTIQVDFSMPGRLDAEYVYGEWS